MLEARSAVAFRVVTRIRLVATGAVPGDHAAVRVGLADRVAAVLFAAPRRTVRFVARSGLRNTTDPAELSGEMDAVSIRAVIRGAIVTIVASVLARMAAIAAARNALAPTLLTRFLLLIAPPLPS